MSINCKQETWLVRKNKTFLLDTVFALLFNDTVKVEEKVNKWTLKKKQKNIFGKD